MQNIRYSLEFSSGCKCFFENKQRLLPFRGILAGLTDFRSHILPLSDCLMLFLFLFEKFFRKVYNLSGSNRKNIHLSRAWKKREVESGKNSKIQSSGKNFCSVNHMTACREFKDHRFSSKKRVLLVS